MKAGGIIRKSLDNCWKTPESILERVRSYFGGPIPFDPATATDNPTKALRFCAGPPGKLFAKDSLESKNGLEVAWDWPWFCNPPYGSNIPAWLVKMSSEAERLPDRDGIALLPASRWETSYMPPTLASSKALCFHRGRIAFISAIDGQPVAGNPGASMFIGWNVDLERFREAFSPLGRCFAVRDLEAFMDQLALLEDVLSYASHSPSCRDPQAAHRCDCGLTSVTERAWKALGLEGLSS